MTKLMLYYYGDDINKFVILNPQIKEDFYLNGDDINKIVILSAAQNPEKKL